MTRSVVANGNIKPYRFVKAATTAEGEALNLTLSGAVQLIIRFYGPPEEIHANYDFIHCTCCWQSSNGDAQQ